MLKAQILSWIMQAVRYKLHPDQITVIMDAAQRMAFDNNSQAFLVWTETLTPKYALTFAAAGYTDAILIDIPRPVVGATSGAEGALVSYDNSTRIWYVTSTNGVPFEDGEVVDIPTGTGSGTLETEDAFEAYLGPYDAPTDPACRKIWGVTTETDGRIFGTAEDVALFPMDDFDFEGRLFSPRNFFRAGREDNVSKTFTFAGAPSPAATYRWVYWRDAPTISPDDAADDETTILIPAAYHMHYVNACIKLAQLNLSGEDVDPKVIGAFFQPWWNTLSRPYTPMGRNTNQTLNKRDSSQSLI